MSRFDHSHIARLRARRSVGGLVKALRRAEHSSDRARAAKALGEIADPRAVGSLTAALNDDDRDVRDAAVAALGKIADERAVEPLTVALRDDDSHVRRAVAEALGTIGDARAAEPLVAALKDNDCVVCNAAAEALDALGWEADNDEGSAAYCVAKGQQ